MCAFLTIAGIHWLALMSPGPDFILVTKNTLTMSRRVGVATAIGLALGMTVHVTYTLIGIGVIIARSVVLFSAMKYLGAAYLVYLGIGALLHKHSASGKAAPDIPKCTKGLTTPSAIRMGFLCNILNPKVTLFFLALFTQVVDPLTPLLTQIGYGLWMSLATFLWFGFVAGFLSLSIIRSQFEKIQDVFTRAMGAMLLALGVRLALASRD